MELKLIPATEVRAMLGNISAVTLKRYRLKYWIEGVHYVKPVQQCLYNKPLIEDWMLYGRTEPATHQLTIEAFVQAQQKRSGRKARDRR
ncbi:excisionase family protein [filamentous cyanobacterium LEGE 11480]|uniref:Excisionase family protein n=1 Tax=Romeriopsis navalis LEGE 11480 TaxID=2777977 RepID=A0A928VUW8_9CYAN|nr:excisionase family protein [Romeriopsis navalis]MBE9033025.1 excisionase family protein [Romeriopsis navalis LEGE 11480]